MTVPIYPTLSASQARYILQDSSARLAVVSTRLQLEKIQEVRHQLPALEAVVRMDAAAAVQTPSVLAVDEGAWLGVVGGRAVASGPDRDEVARAVLDRILDGGAEVLTVLLGDGAAPFDRLRDALAAAHEELEIEVHAGGQPHWALLLSAE